MVLGIIMTDFNAHYVCDLATKCSLVADHADGRKYRPVSEKRDVDN